MSDRDSVVRDAATCACAVRSWACDGTCNGAADNCTGAPRPNVMAVTLLVGAGAVTDIIILGDNSCP
jgi:hypothetical protein